MGWTLVAQTLSSFTNAFKKSKLFTLFNFCKFSKNIVSAVCDTYLATRTKKHEHFSCISSILTLDALKYGISC